MVRTSLNDMWREFVSNDTKPSRSEKFGVRDTFYDTMTFDFSQDSHVSRDIRTGHLPNTSKSLTISANPLRIYAFFLHDGNARVPMKTSTHTTTISRYLTDTYLTARSTLVRNNIKLRFSNLVHHETLYGFERYSTNPNGTLKTIWHKKSNALFSYWKNSTCNAQAYSVGLIVCTSV
jgi:hypothetical protein